MIDVDLALATSREPLPAGPWPDGAPMAELARSPAAARVGVEAARSGLFLFHFEHRLALDLPEAWIDPGHSDDAGPPPWQDGVLPERKYQSFRHDLAIGSLHPAHRAKWTAHELAHGLVGFGWRPDAGPLWLATAARLAELVPVVLWYFLDEVGLRRCPRHAGPRFRALCPACERAAMGGPRPVVQADRGHLEDAARFLERELDAVAATRSLGEPVAQVWGSLDLSSDGIAYAIAHGRRLASPAFHRTIDRFAVHGGGWHDTLDGLEERVREVALGLAEGRGIDALAPDPAAGRARWIRQDLGHRLLQVHEETAGPAAQGLLEVVDGLAEGDAPAVTAARYAELAEDYELPPADVVFAVGYPLDGVASLALPQLDEGLATVVPHTRDLLDDAGVLQPMVAAFAGTDVRTPVRWPLGQRFVRWLQGRCGPDVEALGRFEAALRAAGREPSAAGLGPGLGWRWAEGTLRLDLPLDPVALADRVDRGEVVGEMDAGSVVVRPAPPARHTVLVVGRGRDGQPVVAEIPAHLGSVGPGNLPPDVLAALVELQLVVADRWPAPI